MNTLIALDPGLRYPAVAIFKDSVLVHASRVKIPGTSHKLEMGMRCLNVARLINCHISSFCPVHELVIEWPKVRGRRSKADPADLFPLAGVGCALAGLLFDSCRDLVVISPEPAEWLGGNTSKSKTDDPWASPRGYRAKKALTQAEFDVVIPSHDAVDAVCIALWRLGRFEAVKSYIGAT